METTRQTQASDENEINRNRMVKLCNSTRVCHQRYCMEMLTNIYLQCGEVGYLIMSLLSGHGSMASKKKWSASFMFLWTDQSRMISGIMEMMTGKNWRAKTRTTKATLHLSEMSNFGQSRHLNVGASVKDVNNKDYKFNCT